MRLLLVSLIVVCLHREGGCVSPDIHLVATTNRTKMYQLIYKFLSQDSEYSAKLKRSFVDFDELCPTVKKMNSELPGNNIVIMIHEGEEDMTPCSYKVHRESVNLLQVFNTSIAPRYAPELLFYSRFGKIRLGPFQQRICDVNGPNVPINPPIIDIKAKLKTFMKMVVRVAWQNPDQMSTDLITPLRSLTEEKLVQELLEDRQRHESQAHSVVTVTTFFTILYPILLLYILALVLAAFPDRKLILKSSMHPEEEQGPKKPRRKRRARERRSLQDKLQDKIESAREKLMT
ncbi:unnamed protein product [Bursaphelenchus xylophilus]|uniref:(pine wood nematode) hypothetical protein n=1 Tax=Bursaphelenchus xylophilus TaxID=6326 RepID=A0A7I8XLR9_BURXY|nr:unnamed protein product [Bursaphelenchus xylophilus]CAG9089721.1 unnamed protein product [Bursaphelenchus xylophilus]